MTTRCLNLAQEKELACTSHARVCIAQPCKLYFKWLSAVLISSVEKHRLLERPRFASCTRKATSAYGAVESQEDRIAGLRQRVLSASPPTLRTLEC